MDNFEKVGARLKRMSVTTLDYGNAHGTLSLDGSDSTVELTGELPLHDAPAPGWFDLRVKDGNGQTIFIHNAVRKSMSFPLGSSVRSTELFPNMIVDDASALTSEGECTQISFGLENWTAFFDYNFFETLDAFGTISKNLNDALLSTRFEKSRSESV